MRSIPLRTVTHARKVLRHRYLVLTLGPTHYVIYYQLEPKLEEELHKGDSHIQTMKGNVTERKNDVMPLQQNLSKRRHLPAIYR